MVDTEWVDITSDVRLQSGITINRGQSDEGSSGIDPSSCNLTITNPAGKYSPRNPESVYFGKIGRNTPIRVGIGSPPIAGSTFTTVDSTSLVAPSVIAESSGTLLGAWLAGPIGNITVPATMTGSSELDGGAATMRAGYRLSVAAGATGTYTATYSVTATSQASLLVHVPGAGTPTVYTTSSAAGADISVTPTVVAGDYLVAIVGWDSDPLGQLPAPADYYYNDGNGWTLLTDTGPNSEVRLAAFGRRCNSSSAKVYLQGHGDDDSFLVVYKFSGITDLYIPRFTGEVSEWPSRWNLAETDVTVPLQAYGITRRLNQGEQESTSVLRQWIPSLQEIVAYWPMEDESGASVFSSAVSGVSPMTYTGNPVLAGNTEAGVSAPQSTFVGASATGVAPTYTPGLAWSVGCLITLPDTGMTNGNPLLVVTTSGTGVTWKVLYSTGFGGSIVAGVYDGLGTLLLSASFPAIAPMDGTSFFLYVGAQVSGANVNTSVGWSPVKPESATAKSYNLGSIVGGSLGSVQTVKVADSTTTGDVAIGHVAVASRSISTYATFFQNNEPNDVFTGWSGESAGGRIERLLLENSIPGRVTYGSVSEAMGPQTFSPLLDLIKQCAETDGGILYEPPGFIGLAYRERTAFESTSAGFALDYNAGHISAPFDPIDDDQHVFNDVSVQKIDGASGKATISTGPLSTQAPPNGVGRYSTDLSLSLETDSQATDQAWWRAHLGTWDSTRFPAIHVDLAANPALITSVPLVDIGVSFTLTGLPDWVFSSTEDNSTFLVMGYTEVLGYKTWSIVYNTAPWGPYRTVTFNSATAGRLDGENSTLTSSLNTTATSVAVTTTAGGYPIWTTTATRPTDFPFNINIDDEEMTVTAITGATVNQTFTVTRSVNGIVKSHAAGATVSLAQPNYLALS